MPDKSQDEDATLKKLWAKEEKARAAFYEAASTHDPMVRRLDEEFKRAREEREQYERERANGKTNQQKPTVHQGIANNTPTNNKQKSSSTDVGVAPSSRSSLSSSEPSQGAASSAETLLDTLIQNLTQPSDKWKSYLEAKEAADRAAPAEFDRLYAKYQDERAAVEKLRAACKQAAASEPPVTDEQDSPNQQDTAAQENSPLEDEAEDEQGSPDEAESAPPSGVIYSLIAPDGAPLKTAGLTPLANLMRQGGDVVSVSFTNYEEGRINQSRNDRLGGYARVSLYSSLNLPTMLCGYPTIRTLFDSILALFEKHVMLPKNECSLLAYWSTATWFTDYLPFVPCLVISGPAARADALLRTLAAVCHTPLLLAELNPAVLRKLDLDKLGPVTLLLREPQLNQRMAALLNASNQPGYWFFNGEKFQALYCPKCIYVGEHVRGQSIASNSIQMYVGGNSWRPLPAPPTNDVIDSFQNRLLFYRLIAHDVVEASNFQVSRLQSNLCAIAEVLGSTIIEDPELQRGIIEVLKDRDEQSRADGATGLYGMVLKALLLHGHQNGAQQVFVREIAATVNRLYTEDGEPLKVSSEKVGYALKYLSIYTRRLGNAGRGLVFDKATEVQVHKLGQSYDVLTFGSDCEYCHELQAPQSKEHV
jgi:hypothetical protein